jgi:hypothetical protein
MIGRTVSAEMQAALSETPTRLRAYIEIHADPVVRVHTGLGPRELEGNIYAGLGELVKIGSVKENANSSANRMTLELKILDQTLLVAALNTDMVGLDTSIHLVALDEKRKTLATQMFFYEGEISDQDILKGNLVKQIPYLFKTSISDWYERWSQPANAARCTDAAQQLLYPGDRFFDQVEVISSAPLSAIPLKSVRGLYPRRPGEIER